MLIEITFKSGAQVVFDADEFTVQRSPAISGTKGIEWSTPDDFSRKLLDVDLGEIVAIVRIGNDQGGGAKPGSGAC